MITSKPGKIYFIQIYYLIFSMLVISLSALGFSSPHVYEIEDIIPEIVLISIGTLSVFTAFNSFRYKASSWKVAIATSLIDIMTCVYIALMAWHSIQSELIVDRIGSIREDWWYICFWLALASLGVASLIGLLLPATRKYYKDCAEAKHDSFST